VGVALSSVAVYTEPAVARAVQAEHNLYARIDAEFGMLTSTEAGKRMGSRSSAPRNLATTAHRNKALVAVRRGNYLSYPGFQFGPDGKPLAVIARMTRSAMLEVLREDYIRTARAKGLWEKLILSRHALKNAMLPVLTVIALEFAFLIGGLVVTEQVFNLNGIGLLFVQAVAHRDYTLIQALVMLVAGIFIFVNFAMDVMYAWLDPRIRYR